jgi:hypothetical protein
MIPAPVSATCLFVVIRLAARWQIRSAGTVARRGLGCTRSVGRWLERRPIRDR